MEDTRKLLDGIGQPDFAYRRFDDDALLAAAQRWPLMRIVAESAGLWRGTQTRHGGAQPVSTATFLHHYGSTTPPSAGSRSDVRSLLDRLARDDR